MAEFEDREHYIPLRKGDLTKVICRDPKMSQADIKPLEHFCTMIGAIYHFEYLEKLEELKDLFAPFNPDSETIALKKLDETQREKGLQVLFDGVVKLMERANFKRLTREDIEAAMEGGASDWGINMEVNFDVFDKLEVFVRGEGVTPRVKRHPILFWRKVRKKVDTYSRMMLLLKLKPHKLIPETVDTEGVYLKLFKEIPKLDIEMVLPGARIQMPGFTKGKLGVSIVGTIGYGLYAVGYKLITAITTLATVGLAALGTLIAPVGVLGGYAYKQWYGYNVTKQTYSKMLTESLYYQTLDNNLGVISHLVDEAEEQECREAILAYWALWLHAPEEGWTEPMLDDWIELWLENTLDVKIDFEVDDAMDKVLSLGIVEQVGDRYRAIPLEAALEKLDYKWDNYFQYNQS